MKEELIELATAVRMNSYSPYSKYQVGSAILGEDDRTYVGCNFENISYGLCICAERNAVGNMVSNGCTKIKAVAVVTADGGGPCGACRQVLIEFMERPDSVPIYCADLEGNVKEYSMSDLLPHHFESEIVG